jgi:hypothetical protein
MHSLSRDRHHVSLVVSAEDVRAGCSVTLSWNVVGVDANVASVHFSSSVGRGSRMIEGVPSRGTREIIFAHPGTFTFTLTVTFGDGVKRERRVTVVVRRRTAIHWRRE